MQSRTEIEQAIRFLLTKYHADHAILFGSYARNEATPDSDIDVIVFGGKNFTPSNIFAFGEDLREMTRLHADVFEIREVDQDSSFFKNVMNEGIKIV